MSLVKELEKIAAKRGKLDYFKHALIQNVLRDDRNIKSLHAQTLDEVLFLEILLYTLCMLIIPIIAVARKN